MINLLLRAVDTVLDWRIERRRRIPVVPPERFIACPDSQCARLAGHVGPHQPAVELATYVTCEHCRKLMVQAELLAQGCSVHCQPSCSYPKCEES